MYQGTDNLVYAHMDVRMEEASEARRARQYRAPRRWQSIDRLRNVLKRAQ